MSKTNGTVDPAELQRIVDSHDFLSWLGLAVETAERGSVELTMADDDRFRNPFPGDQGPIHGGITATLVDTASGFVLRTTFDDPLEATLTTTDLDVSYLEPATGNVRIEAEVVRAGGTMGVADVTVSSAHDEGGERTIAVGRATYRLFRDA
ncbi:PaaI family thioesterase [Natronococcus pandeyae]|uniref:PaaI family thioesterase n=1 Tax=Natronococcus pandeyae TaxID=2055836 RepID=A0A8J8Q024_9EURY|nr:PaaI family thioesterase [Natronococcus pandeyae]TYL36812.1 PaaI family thioesterase [Natronococcus pandeyae]